MFVFFLNTESSSAGTWTLNVLWKMCGIDVHMDPNIGKRLNALGNTLTTLTGEEDIDDIADLNSVNIADLSDEDEVDTMSPTIHAVSKSSRISATNSKRRDKVFSQMKDLSLESSMLLLITHITLVANQKSLCVSFLTLSQRQEITDHISTGVMWKY